MAAERASPCSDSSSQSGMADNETEADRSQQSERSAPQDTTDTAPPKKKRTRTLTTPHQSAVLHALLAKSRFPTTAMREEVGRQIGLSARKVQIWFQNQRQKARRPQAESAPLTRPPQFGPFPLMTPAGSSSSSYPSPSAGPSSFEMPHAGPSSSRPVMHESTRSPDSVPALSGPGMPGWSPPPQRASGPSSPREWEHPRRAPTSPQTPQRSSLHALPPPRLSEGTSTRDSRGTTRVVAPPPTQPARLDTSPPFSRMLPPIHLSPLEPRPDPPFPTMPSFPPLPPSRMLANTSHRHSESSARSPAIVDRPGSPRSNIPPPFALQPQPQWDPHAFSPYTRPEFASWSPTSFSARSSFSAGSGGDRTPNVSPSSRHYLPALADPQRGAPLDSLSHHMISPSRSGRGTSTSASSPRPSGSGHGHARSDNTPPPRRAS